MTQLVTVRQHRLLLWMEPPGKRWRSARVGTAIPEFLSFRQHVDGSVPNNLDIHLTIDHRRTYP